ncbi:MAG: adenine phosphoribosyltransferase, partial [Planctomycetota bacterium]|nr:adenine phosphoribosyltransferase [Planctomycetota bacterium]
FAQQYEDQGIDVIAAAEARGFIFAVPLAMRLKAAFVPVRKPGKLPFRTHSLEYELEYGTDCLEIHEDSIVAGQRVLIIDDLLATGGTVEACCRLVEQCGATVAGCGFLINLAFLNGADRLAGRDLFSILEY